MRTNGGRQMQGRVIRLPEGKVTVLQDSDPMMVLVRQSQLVKRANPEFWSPQWEPIYDALDRCPFAVKPLGDFIPERVTRFGQTFPGITYGQVGEREYPPAGTKVRLRKGEIILELPSGETVRGVAYYQARNLRRTGLDIFESLPGKRYIVEGSHNDPLRSRIQNGDMLLIRSGIGSLGRCVIVTNHDALGNISQQITRIVLQGITPEWVVVFLQTLYGAKQMERQQAGVVGQAEIDFDEVRTLLVPVPDDDLQRSVAAEYRLMASFHEQAMQAKAMGNLEQAESYLQVAEGMLEALIVQVEQVMEGKRDSITPLIPDGIPEKLRSVLEAEYRRIGELHRQKEGERDAPRILGIPTQRHEEVLKEVERLLRLVESLQVRV